MPEQRHEVMLARSCALADDQVGLQRLLSGLLGMEAGEVVQPFAGHEAGGLKIIGGKLEPARNARITRHGTERALSSSPH